MKKYWNKLGIVLVPFGKDERNYKGIYGVIDKIARRVRALDKRLEFSSDLEKLGEEISE
jgi:lysyl-tRNA synthetase class I